MLKKTCVLLALAAVLTTMLGTVNCDDDDDGDDDPKRCGENMVFSPCGGSCQITCQNISNVGTAEKCTEQCKPGCSCQHGYVLQNRKCIPAKECTCPSNAEYKDCGGVCPFTCQDVANNTNSKVCTMQCKIGCFCKEGYVLNSSKCVLKKDCPCNSHAHYETCGTACPITCDNHLNPPKSCIELCVPGCFCDKSYVKFGNTCVLPEQCPSTITS